MIAPLLSLAIASVSYQIPPKTLPYNLSIALDGYIPVIMHRDGKVNLEVAMTVKGLPDAGNGSEQATTDVTSLKLSVDGSVIPTIDRDSVAQYFPETVTLSPQGKLIENSMPKQVDLPVHLPGVDIKHFPDLTFLAVEFPAQGIEQGTPWTFTRDLEGSPCTYTVTPTSVTDDKIEMNVSFNQDYAEQEGDAYEPVTDPRDVHYQVSTHVVGSGTVVFDRKLGLVSAVNMTSDAKGDVTNIETKAISHRDLKTSVVVALAPEAAAS